MSSHTVRFGAGDQEQSGASSRRGTDPVLGLDQLSVDLGGRRVLDGVTFSLGEGAFAGLIGGNGAGKTTLFRTILGLQKPAAGTVWVAGRAWSRGNPAVGYVPQQISVDPDVPVRARDLVGLGVDGHRFGFSFRSSKKRELVEEMLSAVGAEGFADARIGTLSGGETQRVLIAHALAGRPRLLLLDEPLSNLDLRASEEIVGILARLCSEQGVSVLVSSHEINPLVPVMDQVVYLADGRAVSGPVSEVIQTEVLSRLYGHHVEVLRIGERLLVVAGEGSDLS
jgi:zinc/manganese transport system ATP-binding protein